MRQVGQGASLVGTALLAITCWGCGGGGDNNPAAPTPQVQNLDFDHNVASLSVNSQDVAIFQNASVTATLTWGNANNDLDLFLTDASCSYDANNDTFVGVGCTGIVAQSVNGSGTTEVISRQVTSGQTLRFWITNIGNSTQGAHLNVRLQQ
jgi:hypothetical protein